MMQFKQKLKSILLRFYLVNLISELVSFQNEKRLLAGKSKPKSNQPSILLFTTHKCASGYAGGIIRSLTKNVGMTSISVETFFDKKFDKPVKELSNQEKQKIIEAGFFRPKGYYYGPLRTYSWPIENIQDYQILLMLRDPRDVLTSLYFSVAYSHMIPTGKKLAQRILDNRTEVMNKSIDEWVLENAPYYLSRYEIYCEKLLGKPNVFFCKYEDMVNDFSKWLDSVIKSLQLNDVDQQLRAKLINEANFDVEEDIYAHKRQAQPGDHRRKLKPETISQLNYRFGDILSLLDYEKVPTEV